LFRVGTPKGEPVEANRWLMAAGSALLLLAGCTTSSAKLEAQLARGMGSCDDKIPGSHLPDEALCAARRLAWEAEMRQRIERQKERELRSMPACAKFVRVPDGMLIELDIDPASETAVAELLTKGGTLPSIEARPDCAAAVCAWKQSLSLACT
jgi:hypothetical protein